MIDPRISGIQFLSRGIQGARDLLGQYAAVIPVLGQVEAIDRGVRAATGGNYTGAAEALADVIPVGRGVSRAVKAITKGKSAGDVGGLLNIDKPRYQGSHSAPDKEYGAPLNDLSRDMYPADVYSANGLRYYGSGQPGERQSLEVARKVRGNPDAMVTVYRAAPKGAQTDINPGDWITPSKEYAKYHGDTVLKGQQGQDYEIISKQVPAKHVYTDANSLAEFGYDPTGLGIQGGSRSSGLDSSNLNRYETEADRRMEIARRNAALPVEQGGLGLPENNTPMDRAKAGGYIDVGAHYTPADVSSFEIGSRPDNYAVWTTKDKEMNMAAHNIGRGGDFVEGTNAIPLMARVGNRLPLTMKREMGLSSDFPRTVTKQDAQKAIDAGYDNATIGTEMAIFRPEMLRSRFAAFDPMRRNEADLLALSGGSGTSNLLNINPLLGLLSDER